MDRVVRFYTIEAISAYTYWFENIYYLLISTYRAGYCNQLLILPCVCSITATSAAYAITNTLLLSRALSASGALMAVSLKG